MSDEQRPVIEISTSSLPAGTRAKDSSRWWFEVITIAGPVRIAYSAAMWRILRKIVSTPADERDEELQLPVAGHPETKYEIHSECIVSFFVSTPEQRAANCLFNEVLLKECKENHPREWEE